MEQQTYCENCQQKMASTTCEMCGSKVCRKCKMETGCQLCNGGRKTFS